MPKAPKWINDAVETLISSKMPLVKVTDTAYVNSNIKRIRFQGDFQGLQLHAGYAIAIRVNDTEYRNYTPVPIDGEKNMIDVIIHLHGNAPGSRFMNDLKMDDALRLIPPRGKKMYNEAVKQQFFFGDETTLGLACAMQYLLKKNKHRFHFYFELAPENRNIPALLGLECYSILPKGQTFIDGDLVNSLSFSQWPAWRNSNFIVTGNAASAQMVRKALKQQQVTGAIMVQAYWAAGKKGL